MKLRIASLLATALLAACGESAPPPPPQTAAAPAGPNAADLYRDCFRRFDPDLVRAAASVTLRRDRTEVEPGMGYRDLDDVARTLTARQDTITVLIEASRLRECDFGLKAPDATGSPDHTEFCAKMRNAARVLNADAARLAEAGDGAGAAERLAAIYGLGVHAADEPVLIVALTNGAIIGLANHSVGELAAADGPRRLTPDAARALEAAIARLDRDDPAGIRRAHAAEPGNVAGLEGAQTRIASDLRAAREALARIK